MKSAAIFLCTALTVVAQQTPPTVTSTVPADQLKNLPLATFSPAFHLFFLGHEIGMEEDSQPSVVIYDPALMVAGPEPAGPFRTTVKHFNFRFVDRGTEVIAKARLELDEQREPYRFQVEGRNYRLFASDSDVEVTSGRAHVRDLKSERDIEVRGKPFFPIDNYAPIGVQQELIRYWNSHGRPAEIASAPAGPIIRIRSRGMQTIDGPGPAMTESPRQGRLPFTLERLAIDGVVWGRETAWIIAAGPNEGDAINGPARPKVPPALVAVTTWAGALPFEAFANRWESLSDWFIKEAVKDRITDLEKLTAATPTIRRGNFALTGATVITATDVTPIVNATIVVRDSRIVAVGPSASTTVPRGVPITDVRGKTIIPGLWDSHAHAGQTDWAPVYLASGVTTIRDMGGEEPFLIAIRDAIASGKALGPRYLLAGLIDGPGPRAFGMVSAATPDEARAIVRRYHDEHFNEIKIYLETPPALVPVITAEAHRLGMTVTGHLPQGLNWQSAVEQGYDGIAHMQLRGAPDSDQSKQQIAFFKEHHTAMDPTLSWNELSGRSMARPLDSLLAGASRLPLPLKRMFDSMNGGNGGSQANSAKLIKAAVDAGLNVLAGTDKGVPGFSLQRELEIYVQGGLTPLQAIQTATIMPARAMKLDKDLGTLEVGKLADLVVLDANPLDDIANIRTARMVLTNGRLYDCNVLWKAAGFAPR